MTTEQRICDITNCGKPEHDCHSGVLILCSEHWTMWVDHYHSVPDWGSGEEDETAMVNAWVTKVET